MAEKTTSATIHSRLGHPVIDADGHWVEFEPTLLDYLDAVAGPTMVDRFKREDCLAGALHRWRSMTAEERRAQRPMQPGWWICPMRNSLDRATAMLPRLLYERMGDFGLDFAAVYPTLALFYPFINDPEVRLATYRAHNLMSAELFRGLGDRLTPAAGIPMDKPAEAIEELEFATGHGLKVMMMTSMMRRPIRALQSDAKSARYASWPETFGVDSEYDYDPVWAKCLELRVAPTFHSGGVGLGTRVSYSNFVFNHIGHFAAAGEAVCRSLFLAGVTRRFPGLKFAFLEGGVGWACTLYSDLIGHWKKRSRGGLEDTNPANLDLPTVAKALRRYGTPPLTRHAEELEGLRSLLDDADFEPVDDFAACGIERPQDIRDLFVDHFYFGCESEDPINAWAFRSELNPYGAKLHAIMGSDIGHFDVADMTGILAEGYELVERKHLSEKDFREFVFGNPVRLWGASNPDFFRGTVVEKAAAEYLADGHATSQPAAAD